MKQSMTVLSALILGVAVDANPSGQTRTPDTGTRGGASATASATLEDAHGRSIGEAHLRQTPHGVLLAVDLVNAPPGTHGLHIHEVGTCEGPSFKSAGGHYNPSGTQHGFLNSNGPHAGDLANIEIPKTGQLSVEQFLADVRLEPDPKSLLDDNGSAIVLHSTKDDYASDPAGMAGDRLACGEISPSDTGR
jgi:superoxide dismutase, Cu-Zn family